MHERRSTGQQRTPTEDLGKSPSRTPSTLRSGDRGDRVQQEANNAARLRTRSIDANVRTGSIRAPAVNGSGSGSSAATTMGDRVNLARRGSAPTPAPRQESGCEDDCAEYSDRFLNGYERSRLLGRGACAVVWLAVPTGGQQGRAVAIKQVAKGAGVKKRSDCDAARKEIFFGSYLFHTGGEPKLSPTRHPGIQHVAKLLEYCETKRDIWLVMEYGGTSLTKSAYEIKGEFLRGERLYRVNHLPLLQAMKRDHTVLKSLLRQLLSALCIFAEHHIVHSDIKPDNILVEEDVRQQQFRVRFIDLGSAFTFDCMESLALATPEYMPPEALETCVGRSGFVGLGGGGGTGRLSMASRTSAGGSTGSSGRASAMAAKAADQLSKLQKNSQPWSFDVWSLGSIVLELCTGMPLWLSYKCRVADDQRTNSAAMGLFAVPGRDPEKILQKQSDALRQRGLATVLRGALGVPLGTENDFAEGGGLDLLSKMLAWEPTDRISPQAALEHSWLRERGGSM